MSEFGKILEDHGYKPIPDTSNLPKQFLYYEKNDKKFLIQYLKLNKKKDGEIDDKDYAQMRYHYLKLKVFHNDFILQFFRNKFFENYAFFFFEFPDCFLYQMNELDKSFLLELSIALNFVHKKEFMHREISDSYIAFKNNHVKLILPFRVKEMSKSSILQSISNQNPRYADPKAANQNYSFPADIYSLGVIFEESINKIPSLSSDEKSKFSSLINRMKAKYVNIRPDITEVFQQIEIITGLKIPINEISFNDISFLLPISFQKKYPKLHNQFRINIHESGKADVIYLADKETKRMYVLKLNKSGVTQQYLMEECEATRSCQGPSVVNVIDWSNPEDVSQKWLLLDYIPSLPLPYSYGIMRKEGPECYKILYGVARAMEFISQKYIHRDLSPQNIIFTPNYEPIIIDFGESLNINKKRNGNKNKTLPLESFGYNHSKDYNTPKGTPSIMPPESKGNPRIYSDKTDVYSYGATFDFVFKNVWYKDWRNLSHNDPPECSEFLQKLFIRCLDDDPNKRPKFSTICEEIDKYVSKKDPKEFRPYYEYREYLDIKYNKLQNGTFEPHYYGTFTNYLEFREFILINNGMLNK